MDTPAPSPGQAGDQAPSAHSDEQPRAPLCAGCRHCIIEAKPRRTTRRCSHIALRHVVDGSPMDCYHARFHPFLCGPRGRYFQLGQPVESTVNALRLMDAAPAMHQALRGLVRGINLSELNGASMALVGELHTELLAADQALNQAEGRA